MPPVSMVNGLIGTVKETSLFTRLKTSFTAYVGDIVFGMEDGTVERLHTGALKSPWLKGERGGEGVPQERPIMGWMSWVGCGRNVLSHFKHLRCGQ